MDRHLFFRSPLSPYKLLHFFVHCPPFDMCDCLAWQWTAMCLKRSGWLIVDWSLLLSYLERSWLSLDQSSRLLRVAYNETVCVYVFPPVCLMYYLCADLSDVRVNTRPSRVWAGADAQRRLLYVSAGSGLVWPRTVPPPLSCIRPETVYEHGRLSWNSWGLVSPDVL